MSFTERTFFIEAQLDRIEEMIEDMEVKKPKKEEEEEKYPSIPAIYISSSGSSWSTGGSDVERQITLMAKYLQLVEIVERLKAEYGY